MFNKQRFIEIAHNVHENKYDYSNINYIDSKTKIESVISKIESLVRIE